MKAFLIKILPPTKTLPTRLKVQYPQKKSITFNLNNSSNINDYCSKAIESFMLISWMTIPEENILIGQLPNGDYCGVYNYENH